MTAQVHEGAAAGAIDVPEPLAVRAEMLFALFDEIDFSEGAGIGHFFRFQIFRREEKLLAVHQQNAVAFRDGDHLLALRDGHGQRLFTDDMFAGSGAQSLVICACRLLGAAMVTISMSFSLSISR